jgi:hypothetical protein
VTAAFIITPASGPTTEAHDNPTWDAGFGVSPSSRPTANVTIPLLVSDATEGAIVGPTSVTMTPFDIPAVRTVTLVGVDDGIDDGNVAYTVVLGTATSADPNYNGLNPSDVAVTNVDNDTQAAQCGPRPKVNVSVTKIAPGQLRATVTVGTNPGTQNEIQGIGWAKLTTAAVFVDSVGPVQAGQSTFFGPLTQSASFVITRTPGAQSATVELTVVDACGPWPTVVGGGPNAW